MEKLIITAALTGSQVKKEQNENLPDTPEEIAEDAQRCLDAGASIVHIHARDPQREKSDLQVYSECFELVRSKCKVLIQMSTGSRDRFGRDRKDEERLELVTVEPRPDMMSVDTGTFIFHNLSKEKPVGAEKGWFLHMNSPDLMDECVKAAKRLGIVPEYEAFNSGGLFDIENLFRKGLLTREEKICVNIVMGVAGTQPCDLKNLILLVEGLPENSHFCVMAIGRHEFPIVTGGIILGAGGARVGLEDNIYLSKGVKASNAQLVEKIVRIARDLGREIATVDEAKKILNIA